MDAARWNKIDDVTADWAGFATPCLRADSELSSRRATAASHERLALWLPELKSAVMSDFEATGPREIPLYDPESGKTSGPTVVGGVESVAGASPLPPSSSGRPVSATMAEAVCPPRVRRSLSRMRRGLIVAAALMASITGLFVGVGASSASASQPVPAGSSADTVDPQAEVPTHDLDVRPSGFEPETCGSRVRGRGVHGVRFCQLSCVYVQTPSIELRV